MIRKAFLMRLKPDQQREYVRRHNPIWSEMQAVLKDHGEGARVPSDQSCP